MIHPTQSQFQVYCSMHLSLAKFGSEEGSTHFNYSASRKSITTASTVTVENEIYGTATHFNFLVEIAFVSCEI